MRFAFSAAATFALFLVATGRAEDAPAAKIIKIEDKELKQLDPTCDVWIDAKQKLLVLDGQVCLRDGFLEMFACLKNTKEHEALLAVKTQAFVVHAGLLAIGAQPGKPAAFRPTYQPATGQEIEIYVLWTDDKGTAHQATAQSWIRDTKTKKAMTQSWVFAGSSFWVDDDNKRHYRAESGDFICVSNFPSAMLDLPIESSDKNDDLSFEAFTERIPAKGTKVRIVLIPKPGKAGGDKKAAETAPKKPE